MLFRSHVVSNVIELLENIGNNVSRANAKTLYRVLSDEATT